MKKLASLARSRDALNLSSLYAALVINALVNLGLIAYLARVLRPDMFGLVLLAQAFGFWVAMIPEYGFSLSAGRAVARAAGDDMRIATISHSVNAAKALLALLTIPICVVAYFAVSGFNAHPAFLVGAGLFAIAQGLDPIWLFQGTERNVPYAIISSAGRGLLFALALLLVRSPEDGERFMFIQAFAAALVFAAGWIYLRRNYPSVRLRRSEVVAILRDNWHTFQFRWVQALTTTSSVVILGIVSPPGVQAFGSAERIVRNCLGLLGPISAAGMPRISRLVGSDADAARKVARLSFVVMAGFGSLAGAAIFLLAPVIVRVLLGPDYEFVTPVLRTVSLALPFAATSSMLGVQWMLPLGLDRTLVGMYLIAGLINVAGCVVLGSMYSAMGVAVTMVAVEALLVALILAALGRAGHLGFLRR
ncbi:MAG TPA: oligosaccharide flippase family protein [Allosphingosinicella sp.]|nr:oligosaccharide flippase family protein [Allosphingosinicella sp.]